MFVKYPSKRAYRALSLIVNRPLSVYLDTDNLKHYLELNYHEFLAAKLKLKIAEAKPKGYLVKTHHI